MISPEHVRLMARYNAWQNESLIQAADGLGDAARLAGGGAFWGSIAGTLNHILWADHIWMSRLAGWPKPALGQKESPRMTPDWAAYLQARRAADAGITAYAETLEAETLRRDLSWFSGSVQRDVSLPVWMCLTHLFNHQTHHRGQAHALITAAGGRPEDTDLFLMPGLAG